MEMLSCARIGPGQAEFLSERGSRTRAAVLVDDETQDQDRHDRRLGTLRVTSQGGYAVKQQPELQAQDDPSHDNPSVS